MSSADHWRLLWDRGEGRFLQMRAIHGFRAGKNMGKHRANVHRCAVICLDLDIFYR